MLLLVFGVWFVCVFAAVLLGPPQYSGRILVAVLFLGPAAIGVALVMKATVDHAPEQAEPVVRAIAERRRRLGCIWWGAKTDVPKDWKKFDCWQCGATLDTPR